MKQILISLTVLILTFTGCSKNPDITDEMLDSGKIFDPSLYHPEKYLVSVAKPNPTADEAKKPVIIACHGYSATTFEWDELRTWMGSRDDFYLSQVLLGGHGRSYDEFKKSTWKDWQSAIIDEYTRLVSEGYTNINFLASSASCALILDLLATHYFDGKTVPMNIMLVDPFVIPSNKMLSMIGIVGPMLGYTEVVQTAAEDKVWYHFRPQETLQELQNLATIVRKDMEDGIVLPKNCVLKVYKSKKDPTADAVGAVLIYKGVKTFEGNPIAIDMINSDLHVFTRLSLREKITTEDYTNQLNAFNDIAIRILTSK